MREQRMVLGLQSILMQSLLALVALLRRVIGFVFSPVLRPMRPASAYPRRARVGRLATSAAVAVPVAIAVPPTFAHRDYSALLVALAAPGSKLLDLSSARAVRSDLFTALGSSWCPDRERVPKLAIVLRFEHWAILRDTAALQLAPLRDLGIEIGIFYTEQTLNDRLLPWFEHGTSPHNVAAVLSTLRGWQPSPVSPIVLEAVSALVCEAVAGGAPASHIVELATIALASGANLKALSFAREALFHLGEVASSGRLEALRVLGFALMSEGRSAAATGILDGAVAMAIGLGAMEDAAELLRQLGSSELDRGEARRAAERFRTAIELVRPGRSELVASLHYNLAIALLSQGAEGAELHAIVALASRPNKRSPSAQMDLELLGSIRSGKGLAS